MKERDGQWKTDAIRESRRKTDSEEERKRDRENARTRDRGKEDTKRKAKRKGVRVRENGYEPSMEFEACLNRLQLPERVDRGYRGLL